jgi:Zn-dependent metalloprotease
LYNRSQDEFEQVMAYYWVTQAQLYIQRLGFGSTRRPVNAESQDIRINQYGADNSFWTNHPKDEIRFGKGGVDDAEDAEVILHEYGHAIQDAQVANFGSSPEGGAIGEAFGDYWAVTVTDTVAHNGFDVPCVADWDSVSYTSGPSHCLRRVDTDKHYPEDVVGEVHADGEIWSRALWDIRNALGSTQADTIILESQFSFAPDTTFAEAAAVTVTTAQKIGGTKAAKAVTAAFANRGIL